jgi:hypothetical protein
MRRSFLQVLILSLALLVPVVTAQALPVWLPGDTPVGTAGPMMTPMTITAQDLVEHSGSWVEDLETGAVTFSTGSMMMMNMWLLEWDEIILDPDPSVAFVGAFTNLSGSTQNFIFSISTPISPALLSSTYGGSTSVTVGDTGTDGATLASPMGQPGYAGTIDTANQLLLLNPFSLPAGPGGTNSLTQSNGLYATIPGPPVNSTIGITHRFSLTTLDNATFNSTFNVIPEPATIALIATGLGGLAALGRRRRT